MFFYAIVMFRLYLFILRNLSAQKNWDKKDRELDRISCRRNSTKHRSPPITCTPTGSIVSEPSQFNWVFICRSCNYSLCLSASLFGFYRGCFFQATLTDKARVQIQIVKETSGNWQLISAICEKLCDLADTTLGEFVDTPLLSLILLFSLLFFNSQLKTSHAALGRTVLSREQLLLSIISFPFKRKLIKTVSSLQGHRIHITIYWTYWKQQTEDPIVKNALVFVKLNLKNFYCTACCR